MEINGKEIKISNPDKVLFPDDGFTKQDIVDYYSEIAGYLIPYAKDRPVMMQRFPDGIGKSGFYHKEVPDYFPDWINTGKVDKKEGGTVTHVICDSRETLVYLANQGSITLHTWLSRIEKPKHPDKVIIDLDPPGNDFTMIRSNITDIKNLLDDHDLKTFLMTTGSAGLHMVIPVEPDRTFDKVKKQADRLADLIVENFGDDFTTAQLKEKRRGKIYVDSQRNSYAQTGVTPYSLRPKEGAPVATPIEWEEASAKGFNARSFHVKNIFRRLSRKKDPWSGFSSKSTGKHNAKILKEIT